MTHFTHDQFAKDYLEELLGEGKGEKVWENKPDFSQHLVFIHKDLTKKLGFSVAGLG